MDLTPGYDGAFAGGALEDYVKSLKDFGDGYKIHVDFSMPPVILCARFMRILMSGKLDEEENQNFRDQMLHRMIVGKDVKISFNGVEVGAFKINGLDDNWDAFEIFHQHPVAFSTLQNVAEAWLLGKYKPPRTNGAPVGGNKA